MAYKEQTVELTVSETVQKVRLDSYLAQQGFKRSIFSDPGTQILVDGKPAKKSKLVNQGDHLTITYGEEVFEGLTAQDIPLKVLYEDEQLLVIDKEQGMVVHPAAGNHEGTVVNALLFRYGTDFDPGSSDDEEEDEVSLSSAAIRPGIVHRLDKDTSGALVIARTRESYRSLLEQFKAHTTGKTYIALVKGNFRIRYGTIESNITRDERNRKRFTTCSLDEGRRAFTEYTVLRQFKGFSLLRIVIRTGRTHQIRVHLASLNHPLVGDVIYGKEDGTTLMLHALKLAIDHPETGKRVVFTAPLPARFLSYVQSHRT